jgi:hypothetical protein
LSAGLARSLVLTVFAFWTLAIKFGCLSSNKLEGVVADSAFTGVIFTFHAELAAFDTSVADAVI